MQCPYNFKNKTPSCCSKSTQEIQKVILEIQFKTKYEMTMLQDRTKVKDKKELVSKPGRKAHSQYTQEK